MTAIAPVALTANSDTLPQRAPIGTRYTCHDGGTYTLVAHRLEAGSQDCIPVLLDDDDLNDGDIVLQYLGEIIQGDQELEVTPADEDTATRARAAAVARYQEGFFDSGELHRVLAFADLTSDEAVSAFWGWIGAELNLRAAQENLAKASAERAVQIDRIVTVTGSQDKAGRLTGLNQSSISRALRSRAN